MCLYDKNIKYLGFSFFLQVTTALAAELQCRDALPLLGRAATIQTHEITQRLKQIESLKIAGFAQLEQSDYYVRGGFLLQPQENGGLKAYVNISPFLADTLVNRVIYKNSGT